MRGKRTRFWGLVLPLVAMVSAAPALTLRNGDLELGPGEDMTGGWILMPGAEISRKNTETRSGRYCLAGKATPYIGAILTGGATALEGIDPAGETLKSISAEVLIPNATKDLTHFALGVDQNDNDKLDPNEFTYFPVPVKRSLWVKITASNPKKMSIGKNRGRVSVGVLAIGTVPGEWVYFDSIEVEAGGTPPTLTVDVSAAPDSGDPFELAEAKRSDPGAAAPSSSPFDLPDRPTTPARGPRQRTAPSGADDGNPFAPAAKAPDSGSPFAPSSKRADRGSPFPPASSIAAPPQELPPGPGNPFDQPGTAPTSPFVTPEAPQMTGESYRASRGFGQVQGENNWHYLEADSVAKQHREMLWNAEESCWQGSNEFCRIYATDVQSDTTHAERMWVAPRDGKVRIVGTAKKRNTEGGDGVGLSIWKNRQPNKETLWKKGLRFDDAAGVTHTVDTTVSAGDEIYFQVSPIKDSQFDRTIWDPEIAYVE
jgi:hypothetical protein